PQESERSLRSATTIRVLSLSLLAAAIGLVFLSASAAAPPQTASQPRVESKKNPHGPLNIPCQNCHTFLGWRPIRQKPEFNHSQTRFPLRGMHQSVACIQCHV